MTAKRFFSLFLVCTMMMTPLWALASSGAVDQPEPVYPEEPYQIVHLLYASLSISGTTANMKVTMVTQSGTEDCAMTIYLQKLVNGSWKSVGHWYASGKRINFSASTTVTQGTYRLYAFGHAGTEWVSITSNTASC